ncbi:MAG: AMP-binding protein [Gammaproteobacteria bacterium]|nr:AMP-binding protein [Gammaproteobacteria bacterium]MDH3372148.1 AMP-binding protein [Gammaproteobacteria bacterium]MDH3408833.1 AMP-binding protein [Gammaproteobacteria bacterium]MDH3551539.1 AMP-binding protein [Gammaproteobacteria bacterium]
MPTAGSLVQLLYEGAALDPAAVAVETGDEALTYAELMQRVELAGASLQRLLPDPGSRIALCAANHPQHLVAYLAILVSGFVWLPLNPANGRSLNSVIAQKAKPDLLLVDPESVEHAPESDRSRLLDELRIEVPRFKPTYASPDSVAAIKFTGGTSGEPKGVVQTHRNMLGVIENMQVFFEFGPDDCNLVVAPLTHGSSHYVFPVLVAGGRHRFPRDRSSGSILAAMRDNTTVAFMPPTLIYKLLQQPGLSPGQFPALRHLTFSAAPMPPDRIVEAQRAFGPCISCLYGQTEAPMTISALGTGEMRDPSLLGTAGKACGSSRVRVVDDAGVEVPAGTIGNIEVTGPIVMQGYLDEPELTDATVRDGWLRTGDLGFLDASGYLTLSGRASEVIITGGFNVYPAEIENVIAKIPGIRECCVYSVGDPYWGERIEAVVVRDANSAFAGADILQTVRQELGPVRTPKALHIVESLPRNAVGKVVRRDMPEFIESLQEQSDVQSV